MINFVVLLDVKDEYQIGQVIGNGNFAKVHACHRKKPRGDNEEKFALKTVGKSTIKKCKRNIVSVRFSKR